MAIPASGFDRDMALETLLEARIGDQLLVFSKTTTNLYKVKGRSESLTEPKMTLKFLDLENNKESEMVVHMQDIEELDFNILAVFLSKKHAR